MPGFWRHRLLLKSFILICVVRGVQTTVKLAQARPAQPVAYSPVFNTSKQLLHPIWVCLLACGIITPASDPWGSLSTSTTLRQ